MLKVKKNKMNISKYDLLNSEAAAASGLIGSGLTWLRKMDFTKKSYQMQGLFSLSIGLERLMKLIIIYDYRILTNNEFPNDKYLKKAFGHDLEKLFQKCEQIIVNQNMKMAVLDDPIYKDILSILSKFSNQSRYYNLNYLSGDQAGEDCLLLWENLINKEIMLRHCDTEETDFKEDERIIINPSETSKKCMQNATIINFKNLYKNGKHLEEKAKFSMYYTYNIIHFLTNVLYRLSSQKLLPFISEHFRLFLNTDQEFIFNRKVWDNYEVWRNE